VAEWFAAGVGLASAAEPAEVSALVDEALRMAGIPGDAVRVVATIDTRADHPALAALAAARGWPVVTFPASRLGAAADGRPPGRTPVAEPVSWLGVESDGRGPVAEPARRLGARAEDRTPVAEPAALLAAGADATLVVPKRRSARATVAVARAGQASDPHRRRPPVEQA
jgi:cobalt-precorrin 5A hydrolase/precorrin-3B C17-methyltransferase